MDVNFAPELQAKLTVAASQQGRSAEEVVQDAVARYFADEARFLAAVEKGIAAAEHGDLIEEEEMDRRVEQMFRHG